MVYLILYKLASQTKFCIKKCQFPHCLRRPISPFSRQIHLHITLKVLASNFGIPGNLFFMNKISFSDLLLLIFVRMFFSLWIGSRRKVTISLTEANEWRDRDVLRSGHLRLVTIFHSLDPSFAETKLQFCQCT